MESRISKEVFDFRVFNELLSKNERVDSRKLEEWRSVFISRDAIRDGTVLVKFGNTSVVCGVKAVICEDFDAETNDLHDLIELSVGLDNLKPKKEFELRSDVRENQRVEKLLMKIIKTSKLFNLNELIAVEGKYYWSLVVEVVALNDDGNVFDGCVLALVSALFDVRIPVVEFSGTLEFKEECRRLKLLSTPIATTFALCGDNYALIDQVFDEEVIAYGFLTIVYCPESDRFICVEKRGGFSMNAKELNEYLLKAKKRSHYLKKLIYSQR